MRSNEIGGKYSKNSTAWLEAADGVPFGSKYPVTKRLGLKGLSYRYLPSFLREKENVNADKFYDSLLRTSCRLHPDLRYFEYRYGCGRHKVWTNFAKRGPAIMSCFMIVDTWEIPALSVMFTRRRN